MLQPCQSYCWLQSELLPAVPAAFRFLILEHGSRLSHGCLSSVLACPLSPGNCTGFGAASGVQTFRQLLCQRWRRNSTASRGSGDRLDGRNFVTLNKRIGKPGVDSSHRAGLLLHRLCAEKVELLRLLWVLLGRTTTGDIFSPIYVLLATLQMPELQLTNGWISLLRVIDSVYLIQTISCPRAALESSLNTDNCALFERDTRLKRTRPTRHPQRRLISQVYTKNVQIHTAIRHFAIIMTWTALQPGQHKGQTGKHWVPCNVDCIPQTTRLSQPWTAAKLPTARSQMEPKGPRLLGSKWQTASVPHCALSALSCLLNTVHPLQQPHPQLGPPNPAGKHSGSALLGKLTKPGLSINAGNVCQLAG